MFDGRRGLLVLEQNSSPVFLSPMNSLSIAATDECRSNLPLTVLFVIQEIVDNDVSGQLFGIARWLASP
jgi:hypothetical protein